MTYESQCSTLASNYARELPPISLREQIAAEYFDGTPSIAGATVNTRTVLGYPAFWRGVNLIANVCGKLPLYTRKVLPDGGSEIDRTHPAYKLCNRKANEYTSANTLQRTMTLHAQLHGNGYAYIVRDNSGRPMRLILLDPVMTYPVKFIPVDSDPIDAEVWYVTNLEGHEYKLPAEDVLHIRHVAIDGLIGVPVIDLMRQSLGLGMAVREFGQRFFGEGANAGGVLMVPGKIKKEAQENLVKYWDSITSGLKKSHKIAVLQDGAKFARTSFAPDEAQFLETKRFEIIEVANIIGVPPHKLGDNSRSAYNSIEAENRNALDESYDPWLCTWEEECEAKLLTEQEQETESHIIQYDRSKMVQTTFTERMNGYNVGKSIGVLTTNMIAMAEGLPTIGEAGDKRYVPANWIETTAKGNANEGSEVNRQRGS